MTPPYASLDAVALLSRPPNGGQYRELDSPEHVLMIVRALIHTANLTGLWQHLPEHLIQLRAIKELTSAMPENRIDQPVPNPNSPAPAVRPSCPVCFKWLDGPLLECRRVGCPTNPDVADETAEPKE